MMKAARLILLFMLPGIAANAQVDTTAVGLQEVVVSDFAVQPDKPFKEKRLTADSLEKAGRRSIAEVLREETGIFVKSYGGTGVASLSFRGTGASHTNIYWNGLNIGSPTLGQPDFSLMPLEGFDQMNIRYGLASLIDGSGALGGSIRLSNSARWKKGVRGSFSQEVGSFGLFGTSAEVEAGGDKFQSVTGAYRHVADNDFRYPDITEAGHPERTLDHAHLENYGLYQQLYYRADDKNMLSAKIWYNRMDRQLPAPITSQFAEGEENTESMEDEMLNAVVEWNRTGRSSHLYFNAGLSAATNDYVDDGDSISSVVDYRSWQSNLRYKYDLLNGSLLLEGGLQTSFDRVTSSGFAGNVDQLRLASYVKARYMLTSDVGFTGLIRGEQIEETTAPLLGSLGAFWHTGSNGTVKLNAARNYRYPSLNDLYWNPGGNSALQPEDSWNLEAGYRQEMKQGSLKLAGEITFFSSYVDNWIIWTPGDNYWSPQNVRKVHNRGLELELDSKYEQGDWSFSGRLSYSYTASTNEAYYNPNDAGIDKQLIYVPHHKGVAGLSVRYSQFELSYSHRYTGRYYISTDNLTYMPAYSLADVSVGYDLELGADHEIVLEAAVRNLYDWQYQVIPYRPEPGRNYQLKVKYRFR